jgi:hypothetical protein
MTYACNPNTQEGRGRRIKSSSQPELHRGAMSQITKYNETKKNYPMASH